jgi:hypothetical protein
MMWLKIDVVLPRVGAELPFPRLERQKAVSMAVSSKYSDAHIEDYPLPDETVCDGRPPVLLAELFENIMGTIFYFFQEIWRIIEINAERCRLGAKLSVGTTSSWYCESDAQVV